MARYNSVNTIGSIAGGSTISTPASGLLTTITSAGTTFVPNPTLYTGATQAIYNASGSTIILSTNSFGNFVGSSGSGASTISLANSTIITIVSDGTNYIVQNFSGGPISTTTLTASGSVTLNPANSSVSLQPTGTGTVTIAPSTTGTIDKMNIGATTAGTGAFTTLTANGAVTLTSSGAASAYNTSGAALLVSGGVGVAGALYVNSPSYLSSSGGIGTGTTTANSAYPLTIQRFVGSSGNLILQGDDTIVGNPNIVLSNTRLSTSITLAWNGTQLTANNGLQVNSGYPQVMLNNPSSGSGDILGFMDGGVFRQMIGHINTTNSLQIGVGGTSSSTLWNGSIAVSINSSGYVGIGQSVPTSPLHVENSATATTVNFKNNSASGYAFAIAKLGEAYSTSNSTVTLYEVAGTLGNFVALPNSVNTGAILTFNAYNSANGATGAYCGAVAGATGNGAASFVIGRRTGTSTFAESLRVDTSGRLVLNDTLFVNSELQLVGTTSANNISSAGYKELFRISSSRLVTSGIFSISATRGNFVTGATFSWTSSHPVAGTITQLSSTNYTQISVTLDIASDGSAIISVNWTGYDATFPMGYQVTVIKTAGGTVDFSSQGTAWDTVATNYTRYISYTTLANGFKANNGAFTGSLSITGSLSKGSGSFKIDHPLPALTETNYLVHSFIEGPNADLIYRGEIELVDGIATVDIDQHSRMTEGTFEELCRKVQCFTTNETDWTAVRGRVAGNILTIEAQDPKSTATVSWMVIGERKDKHMYETEWADANGEVIVEPLKNPAQTDFPPYPEHVNTSESANGTL